MGKAVILEALRLQAPGGARRTNEVIRIEDEVVGDFCVCPVRGALVLRLPRMGSGRDAVRRYGAHHAAVRDRQGRQGRARREMEGYSV